MKKSPFYYEKCDEYSTGGLVDIQAEILDSSLHAEVKKEKGFLSYVICEKTIIASMKIDLVRMAVRRRSGRIVGLVVGMSPLIADHIAYLRPIVKESIRHFSYPCFMQICADMNNRRKRVATELLRQLEYEARRQNFQAIITETQNDNGVGRSFLVAHDFNLLFSTISPHSNIFFKKL